MFLLTASHLNWMKQNSYDSFHIEWNTMACNYNSCHDQLISPGLTYLIVEPHEIAILTAMKDKDICLFMSVNRFEYK